VKPVSFSDILYDKRDGVATITINRPAVLNAMRVQTIDEMILALDDLGSDRTVGAAILTGTGTKAFSTGGDHKERIVTGHERSASGREARTLTLYSMIRDTPKPIIAAVNGYAIGGGNVLHVLCDLTIASENAVFGQVGPRVGSFDAGFGTAYLARVVGEKRARELWYLCHRYSADDALRMGLVNKVVPATMLMEEAKVWAREIVEKSPTAIAFLKHSFNVDTASFAGVALMGFAALDLYQESEEGREGTLAFNEKRPVDFSRFRR
jgi:dihydroxynaphthoic acid synthetase